jgi:hypothetical protein
VRGAFRLRVIPSSPEATPLCFPEVDPYDKSLLFIRLWNKKVVTSFHRAIEVAAFCLLPKTEIRFKEEKCPKPTDEHTTGTSLSRTCLRQPGLCTGAAVPGEIIS